MCRIMRLSGSRTSRYMIRLCACVLCAGVCRSRIPSAIDYIAIMTALPYSCNVFQVFWLSCFQFSNDTDCKVAHSYHPLNQMYPTRWWMQKNREMLEALGVDQFRTELGLTVVKQPSTTRPKKRSLNHFPSIPPPFPFFCMWFFLCPHYTAGVLMMAWMGVVVWWCVCSRLVVHDL